MRGFTYSCVWVQEEQNHVSENFGSTFVHTRALWIPDALPDGGILIQWIPPDGTMQVVERKEFPPRKEEVSTAFIGEQNVPYAVVQEARLYLKNQASRQAQQEVIRRALDRLTSTSIHFEGRLQGALDKAGIRA